MSYKTREDEIWKDVKGYEGLYQVSSFGRVKHLESFQKNNANLNILNRRLERILKLVLVARKDGKPYFYLTLTKKGKQKMFSVHRLVAIVFIPNPQNKKQVNHIDGNKLNNYVKNLEWATHDENAYHAGVTGLMPRGDSHIRSKLRSKDILEIRKLRGKITHEQIAKKFNVTRSCITSVMRGVTWKHI